MRVFHKIWIDQCEAAPDIHEAFGLQKAIGYLLGEKLLNFLRAADEDSAFAGELPRFIAESSRIFDPERSRHTSTAFNASARSVTSRATERTR